MSGPPITVHWHSHPSEIPNKAWELAGARQACVCLPVLSALQDGAPDFVKSWHYATAHASCAESGGEKERVVGLLLALVIEARSDELLGPEPLRIFVLSGAGGGGRPPRRAAGRAPAGRARGT